MKIYYIQLITQQKLILKKNKLVRNESLLIYKLNHINLSMLKNKSYDL